MSIRWVVIAAAVIAAGIWGRYVRQGKAGWLMAVPPLVWLLHLVLFFLAAQFHFLTPQYLNIWSSAVHLHTIILIVTWGRAKL